ncbi:PepSY-associated TM helix domain-containing protein [Bosea sp. 124]|uniref:PepSY-associated TM helix domain-containing protein n=1 Tax=Bosea sp. 124 TaxID=2135642 RepID=UPI000D3AD149|nr:PepSY-associated TM helix domain-containing protein [Bosea sp. 124]PTM41261.1 PepSY-associated transmembrane protein [Bosea sp. 124]
MALKPYWLRFHRWITLVFALPLIALILSGLVLSVEPLAQRTRPAAPVTEASVLAALARFDPEGKATGLSIRTYDQLMTLNGAGPDGAVDVSLRTGAEIDEPGWADWFGTARQLHERLLLDLGWLVSASTIAMLVLAALGVLMGWPRLRNTLGGWHSVGAWLFLPLIVLSPLTGLAIAFGISFIPAPGAARAPRIPLVEAVPLVARTHDLAGLTSMRVRGGRLLARVYVGDRLASFVVAQEGLQEAPTNWPRALHEGNWHALWGSGLNLALSVVLAGLWGTGLVIWAKRRFRKRNPRRRAMAVPAE